MNDPQESLRFAVEKYPERVQTLPVDRLLIDSARGNDKRPAWIKIAVPDEFVKALRGSESKRKDLMMLVTVPKEILDRSESPIILPNEV